MQPNKTRRFCFGVLVAAIGAAGVRGEEFNTEVAALGRQAGELAGEFYPALETLYKDLHSHPELSLQEIRTAKVLADNMRRLGLTVTDKVGGTGIVCVLENGPGPVIMVRTDLDALPITERTGLPYASKEQVRDSEGNVVGTMHACGHDIHMTCWVGAAKVLVALKDKWKGTLVFIGQPAEERGIGAKAMLEDGLFQRFPKPAAAFALHCDSNAAHGTVGHNEGLALANVDSVDITVRGKGGHGSAPHTTIDPIVIAARIVLDLQVMIGREVDPTDAAVVTVGSIHGGTKHNIIPAEVKLQLTVRSFTDKTRHQMLEAIARIAKAAAQSARAPAPTIKHDLAEFTPAMRNDPALTRGAVTALASVLGSERLYPMMPVMGGEDFSRYGLAGVPICMLRLGTIPPERLKASREGGEPLPSLHSDLFYPIPKPTIETGVTALSIAVLNQLAGADAGR